MTAHNGFIWTREAWGQALRSSAVGAVADHFFTTRQLWLRGDGEAEDWRQVAETIGVPPPRLLRLRQTHGRDIFVHRKGGALPAVHVRPAADPSADAEWPAADISMTDDPTVALAIQVADCVPLLLADPLAGTVAAVHAGWRGTAAGAAIAAVEALGREFGIRPAQLVVAMGPGIGPCCYAVGDELVGAYRDGGFGRHIDRWFIRDEVGGLKLDVWAANRDQLIASGVPTASIHAANLCTADRPDLFASYRRDGPGTGRIAAVIRSRGAAGSGQQAVGLHRNSLDLTGIQAQS